MGERALSVRRVALSGAAAVVSLSAVVPGQGPQYRERWAFLHLEQRRAEVRDELAGRDATMRRHIAGLLAAPDRGEPFRPVAEALAALRGVAADDAFLLRTAMSVFLLPEVVDPVGANEVCRHANVTLYLPHAVPVPGKLAFALEVVDAAGAAVFRAARDGEIPLADLRMGQTTIRVPCDELADGSYTLRLATWIDGAAPGPRDPQLVWTFHVVRGYQAHASSAMATARERAAKLPPLPAALLTGLSQQVARAFTGEPFDGGSRARLELERLDLALANVANGEPVLAGLTGDVATALPTADAAEELGLRCVLRLPPEPVFGTGRQIASQPLVVVVGGAPSYDVTARRPSSPVTRSPVWTSLECRDLGVAQPWRVAFLESPGSGRNFGAHLRAALSALRDLWNVADRPVVLVCEREAAAVAGLNAAGMREEFAAMVLVGAGGVPAGILDQLVGKPVRFVRLAGLPSSEAQERTVAYAAVARAAGKEVDVAWLVDESAPWTGGLAAVQQPLQQFLRDVLAR